MAHSTRSHGVFCAIQAFIWRTMARCTSTRAPASATMAPRWTNGAPDSLLAAHV